MSEWETYWDHPRNVQLPLGAFGRAKGQELPGAFHPNAGAIDGARRNANYLVPDGGWAASLPARNRGMPFGGEKMADGYLYSQIAGHPVGLFGNQAILDSETAYARQWRQIKKLPIATQGELPAQRHLANVSGADFFATTTELEQQREARGENVLVKPSASILGRSLSYLRDDFSSRGIPERGLLAAAVLGLVSIAA